jgi:hypothetical protein
MSLSETGEGPVSSAFVAELEVRVVEAQTSLAAAEALGEPLNAQIAESDLKDLHALASRNDLDLGLDLDLELRRGA